MLKKILLFSSLSLLAGQLSAQGEETNWWFFGYNGGMQFTTGVPLPAPGGLTSTSEGSSSVSDPVTGNLLFYSDGMNVYNASHVLMPNGFGLMGNSSSTQSCLIVPQPGSSTRYYVFTTDCLENSGMNGTRYTVVDMSLAAGMGDVVAAEKNVLLFAPNSEQLAATKHANCTDWWIMTKELNNNVHHAYLLTATGLSGPVTSTIGLSCGSLSYGQGKFTPDGTKYAMSAGYAVNAQLFDFDNSTGLLSNAITLVSTSYSIEDVYGLSFSGDNTKLYLTRGSSSTQIYQYDISSGVAATILASATLIATVSYYPQLQLAKDYKIYIANTSGGNLHVINNPNVAGAGCGYTATAIAYSGTCYLGMCNFPDSYFNETSPCLDTLTAYAYSSNISCNGAGDGMAWVNVSSGNEPYTYLWSPGGSTNDTITNLGPGLYIVTVTDSSGATAIDSVVITEPAVLTANVTTSEDTVCLGTPITLNASVTGGTIAYSYVWNTGSEDTLASNNFTPSTSGYITVDVTDANGCTTTDSVFVTVLGIPVVVSPADTCICSGSSITLTASGTPFYSWSTGATTPSITVTPLLTTSYIVTYTNGTCSTSDTTVVCVNPTPSANISAVDSVCAGTSVAFSSVIASGTAPFVYAWSGVISGASSSVTATPLTSGTIQLVVTDNNDCSDTTTTTITVMPIPDITSPADTCICDGSTLTLTATGTPGYSWSTGETTSSITVSPSVTTTYIVTYDNGVCADSDTTVVCVNPTPVVIASADTTIEYQQVVTLSVVGTGPFEWSPSTGLTCDNCSNPDASPETTTTYIVSTTNAFGCTASDAVTVTIFYALTIPNIITPNGDGYNDNFRIVGLPPQSAVSIFNRWGNLLYETSSYNNDWKADTDGAYYYILKTPDGKDFSGFFHAHDSK